MLGTFRLNNAFLVHRAKIGLPKGSFQGLNSTPCLETPDNFIPLKDYNVNPTLTALVGRLRGIYIRYGLECASAVRYGWVGPRASHEYTLIVHIFP